MMLNDSERECPRRDMKGAFLDSMRLIYPHGPVGPSGELLQIAMALMLFASIRWDGIGSTLESVDWGCRKVEAWVDEFLRDARFELVARRFLEVVV